MSTIKQAKREENARLEAAQSQSAPVIPAPETEPEQPGVASHEKIAMKAIERRTLDVLDAIEAAGQQGITKLGKLIEEMFAELVALRDEAIKKLQSERKPEE